MGKFKKGKKSTKDSNRCCGGMVSVLASNQGDSGSIPGVLKVLVLQSQLQHDCMSLDPIDPIDDNSLIQSRLPFPTKAWGIEGHS